MLGTADTPTPPISSSMRPETRHYLESLPEPKGLGCVRNQNSMPSERDSRIRFIFQKCEAVHSGNLPAALSDGEPLNRRDRRLHPTKPLKRDLICRGSLQSWRSSS